MNLLIDIGNSRTKFCVATHDDLSEIKAFPNEEALENLHYLLNENSFKKCIVSSTSSRTYTDSVINLASKKVQTIELTPELQLPISIDYNSSKTLGKDRIANVCGARYFYPEVTTLSIDIGTCITYDVLENGKIFRGGSITPGFKMRFKAMNDYSAQLPRIEELTETNFPGKSTIQSLESGVYHGILGEINQFILLTKQHYNQIQVVLTGGDLIRFEKGLKYPIFANLKLTLRGLNEILKNNN